MRKYILKLHKRRQHQSNRTQIRLPVLLLLLLCFLLGSILGCFVGSGTGTAAEEITDLISGNTSVGFSGFLQNLFKVSQYHIAVIAAATSVIGVFAIPLISFWRGYFLSCAATAVIASMPEYGVLTAMISCGISAVLTVPCLFQVELDGFELSMRLRAMSSGRSYYLNTDNVPYHMVISLICLLIAAVAECLLVPLLIDKLF